MVDDHSAGTEYTAAEYTGVDQPEDKYRRDGEPPLNRYTLGSDEQPGTTSADLRPEPETDFRSELPQPPTADQLDFLVPPPAPRRPRPEPQDHLSPSLPIPMPEPLAPRPQPTDEYRTELERAATELPTGQPPLRQTPPAPEPTGFPEQPAGTSYFGAAPSVSGSRWRTDQTASWNSDQHHPESDDDESAYRDYASEQAPVRPIEPPVERAVERPVEQPVEQAVDSPVEQSVERPAEPAAERPSERPVEQSSERPVEQSSERRMERSSERPLERPVDAPVERAVEWAPERPAERAAEGPVERTPERPEERAAERPVERAAERPIDRESQRPSERETVRPEERAPERPMERAAERPVERAAERPIERVAEWAPERPVERAPERPVERAAERPVEPASERPTERALERPVERAAERPIEQPAEWAPERPTERAAERAPERPTERALERPVERAAERAPERPTERALERPVERAPERAPERPMERAPERQIERAAERQMERAAEVAPEQVVSAAPGATPNPAPDWGVGGGTASGPRRNEGDGRAEADSTIASNPTPAPRVETPRVEAVAPVMDLGDAWTRVLAGLPPNQRAWLTNSRPVTLHESTAIVAVPDDFTRGQLETRLRPDLERILSESFGRDIRIAVTVDPSLDPELQPQAPPPPVVREPLRTEGSYQPTIQSALTDPDQGTHYSQPAPAPRQEQAPTYEQQPAAQQYAPQQNQPFGQPTQQPFGHQSGPDSRPPGAPSPAQPATEAQGEARLNPKYTFETFVIGSSNRFAHAAAVAVAEAPGKAYNPQLIYGDSGLGKTHLLHAIGHYVRSLYTGARVRYVSSEEFTNDFINAIRDDKASQFQRRYRDVDVLLIDDIQFLEGKIQTQEEFFHTFNTLHNANKQIVISSDRAPKRLEALEDRLRNRFEWGLITDIQPPDLETRIAILRKKAATERLTAPPEVLEFIASKVQTNIRELEGALIRVTAFASLNRQPVDLSLAEIVLKDLIPEGSKPEVTASMIMGQTASYFGLSIDDLCGSSRSRVLVTARQIAMYLCRELTDLSLPKIGQQFGGRDHTTVMHAERKIRQLMSERRSVFNQVTELTNRIKHQAKQQ